MSSSVSDKLKALKCAHKALRAMSIISGSSSADQHLTVLSEVVDEYEEKAEAEEAANLAELERVTADLKRRKNQ